MTRCKECAERAENPSFWSAKIMQDLYWSLSVNFMYRMRKKSNAEFVRIFWKRWKSLFRSAEIMWELCWKFEVLNFCKECVKRIWDFLNCWNYVSDVLKNKLKFCKKCVYKCWK